MRKIEYLVISSLIAITLVITGCNANVTPTATPTPNTNKTETPAPTLTQPAVTTRPTATSTPVSYTLTTSVNPPNSGAVSISHGQYQQGDKIPVTAIAYAGWAFSYWSGDISGNSSSAFITMDSNKTLVANFVDIRPPVISNIATTNATDTKVTITWSTDEPATSQVDYGITAAYGSTSSDKQLVGNHSITLSRLIPNTHYFVRLQSSDAAGNTGLSTYDVVTEESWMAVTSQVYLQGNTVFYNLINNSAQTIVVIRVELDDKYGIVRHTDGSTELEVHNIGPLASGDTLSYSFSSPVYSNFSGWHVMWYCIDKNLSRFVVTSNDIQP